MRLCVLAVVMCGLGALLSACASKVPCAICYEDEWSREPFPGQTKQHIPTMTPEQVDAAMHSLSDAEPVLRDDQPRTSAVPLGW